MLIIKYTIRAKPVDEDVFGELTTTTETEIDESDFIAYKDDLEDYLIQQEELADKFGYSFFIQLTINDIIYADAEDELTKLVDQIEDIEDRISDIKDTVEAIKEFKEN